MCAFRHREFLLMRTASMADLRRFGSGSCEISDQSPTSTSSRKIRRPVPASAFACAPDHSPCSSYIQNLVADSRDMAVAEALPHQQATRARGGCLSGNRKAAGSDEQEVSANRHDLDGVDGTLGCRPTLRWTVGPPPLPCRGFSDPAYNRIPVIRSGATRSSELKAPDEGI
jgi:hypothetical protein